MQPEDRRLEARARSLSRYLQIMVTELGDETFIIAAIMAMRHAKAVVYAGAMGALAFMTVRLIDRFNSLPP